MFQPDLLAISRESSMAYAVYVSTYVLEFSQVIKLLGVFTIHMSRFLMAVTVCWKPNAIPLCFSIDVVLIVEKLLVSHRAPPQMADRGTITRYGGYQGK